jgi:hypothetical protein
MFYTISLPCLLYLDHYIEHSNYNNGNSNDSDITNHKSYPCDTLITAVDDDIIPLSSLIRIFLNKRPGEFFFKRSHSSKYAQIL